MIINSIKFVLVLNIWILKTVLINSLYFHVDETNKNDNNLYIIEDLKILNEDESRDNSTENFPRLIYIDLNLENLKRRVYFEKLSDDETHPIISDEIYTVDNSSKKISHYKLKTDEKSKLYKEIDGQSVATLIQNSPKNENPSKYRMIATINLANDSQTFNILPIKVYSSIQKRQVSSDANPHKNSHGIFKVNPLQISIEKIQIEKNIYDYLKQRKLRKRGLNGIPFTLFVETLVVTDYTIFLDHQTYAQTTNTDLVFLYMKTYFTHYINSVNQRYQYAFSNDTDLRVTVNLKNFLFLQTQNDSYWSNVNFAGIPNFRTYKGRDVLVASKALDLFSAYMNSLTLAFTYDYAIAFVDKDLWSNSGATVEERSSTVGYSYVGKVCTNTSFSIVEEIGGFIYSVVGAHELGHAIGSSHDGDLNVTGFSSCNASDNFLMTPSLGSYSTNLGNLYLFSTCSMKAIKSLLLRLDLKSVSNQAQCLAIIQIVDAFNVYTTYPGLSWSPDDQCKMIYGNTASFCHNMYDQMCGSLACRTSSNETGCTLRSGLGAAYGTTCDSGKICLKNECVSSSLAPSGGACLFGDDIVVNSTVISAPLPQSQMTCSSAIDYLTTQNQFPYAYCLNSIFRNACCDTCKIYDTMSCKDQNENCPKLLANCDSNTQVSGKNITEACARTCGKCAKTTLVCGNGTFLCRNGGKCVNSSVVAADSIIGFRCSCTTGYSGFFCEKKNQCEPNPCKNGGICLRTGSMGYVCQCPDTLKGPICANDTSISAATITNLKYSSINLILIFNFFSS